MEQQRTFSIIEALKYGLNTFYDHFFLLIGAQLVLQAIEDGLPLFAYAIYPSFKNDYTELQTKITQKLTMGATDLITGVDWISLFSQHKSFLMIAFPFYYILISVVRFGLIQIGLDLFDSGSSSLSRLFSWVSRAHKAIAVSLLFSLLGLISIAGFEVISKPLPYKAVTADSLFLLFLLLITEVLSKPFLLFFYGLAAYYCFERLSFTVSYLVDKNSSVYSAFVHSWKISSGNVLRLVMLGFFSVPYVLFQASEVLISPLIKTLTEIIIAQSLIYAYRQLSSESSCKEIKEERRVYSSFRLT
jgi:hypothetical protein